MLRCINCGKRRAITLSDGTFKCEACAYTWDIQKELENMAYIKTVQGREPERVEELPAPSALPKETPVIVKDDLTTIKGIGEVAAKKLIDAGVTSFAELALLPQSDLTDILGVKLKPEVLEQIIIEASEKAGKG